MSKIFISRKLNENSPFLKLDQQVHSIFDLSLISITPIPFELNESYDWYFFYSKNAIKHFFKSELNIDGGKIAVMGKASANYLNVKTGLKAQLIGGSKKETIQKSKRLLKDQKILFIQAKHSLKSVQKEIKSAKKISDLVVYENKAKSDFEIPASDLLIFTSPLNAKVYFDKYKLLPKQKVFAIGPTTALKITELVGHHSIIPVEYSESGLYQEIVKYI